MKRNYVLAFGIILIGILGVIAYLFRDAILPFVFSPTSPTRTSSHITNRDDMEVVANNLDTPWGIAVLPDGDLLITERQGRIQRIGENGTTITIADVEETSEGGLLGIALHPEFDTNQLLYIYYTTNENGGLANQVVRYRLDDDQLSGKVIILNKIPASQNHDGGALAFGPDEKLYITTGDAAQEHNAQNLDSLVGKILRINADGSIPEDNPFGNEVWSYGHRNPQGIAWDEEGRMWSTEHGPSGLRSGRDELNLIEKGANYGWPEITGDETRGGMRSPVLQSGDDETWAPAGLDYSDGSLFFTGLRSQTLYQVGIISDTEVELSRHLSQEYGRLRAIFTQNNTLIIGTSNRDGRGTPASDDDRLIKVQYSLFAD